VSYQAQTQLEQDPTFQLRVRAVNTEQSQVFMDDGRPDIAATARDVLRDLPGPSGSLLRLAAAGPGIAGRVDNGDGTIDQSRVTDSDLLALTQSNFPHVANLYYTTDGEPI
jgi:hypothetical protein